MKEVLIIANLFHASPRIPGFATHLPQYGWHATIVTPPVSLEDEKRLGFPRDFKKNCSIVSVPYRGDILWLWRKLFLSFGLHHNESIVEQIKYQAGNTSANSWLNRSLQWYEAIFGYPDTEKYWIAPVNAHIYSIMGEKRFDIMMSSSPYPTSHLIAAKLRKDFSLPWVADFRDPWTQNHTYPYPRFRKWLDERLEKKVLLNASRMCAASPQYAEKQKRFHHRDVAVITNGFDPDILALPRPPLTKKFSITYTGTVYEKKQNPAPLFVALRELCESQDIDSARCEVRFFGKRNAWVDRLINEHGLQKIVRQYGPTSKEEAISKQRESQILLILGWEDVQEKGVYPQKIFEYVASGRPVIAIGGSPDEDVKKILTSTGVGTITATNKEIKTALLGYYHHYLTNSINDVRLSQQSMCYSYSHIAKQFAELFESSVSQ